MAMAQRLTDKSVWTCKAPESGNALYWDAADAKGKDWIAGFGVRVTAAGARAFIFNYRTKAGVSRRLTIGSAQTWSLSAAREEARRLRLLVDTGADPLAEVQSVRDAATVNALADRFIAEFLPKKRESTADSYKGLLGRYIRPAIGSRKVADVAFGDVDRLHGKVTREAGPYCANRMLAVLSKMFSLAIRWQLRADNPVRSVERNQEHKRTRYLSADELVRLFAALSELEDQQGANVIRLLLLTGARKGELLAAQWSDVDLEASVWTKPAASTKQKAEHRVALSGPAIQLLQGIRKASDEAEPWIFPGRLAGQHRRDVKDAWYAACKVAKITGVRVHDLRHTYASLLASDGQSLLVIGALLGHTQPATTARYAHLLDDPLRRATERVGAILAGNQAGEIVPLKGHRRG
jgi:integrase